MRMMTTLCGALIAAATFVSTTVPSSAADPYRDGRTTWQATVCQKGHVLGLIKSEFNRAQIAVFRRDLAIEDLYDARLEAERFKEPLYHDRAYCMARALLSNGQTQSVYYKVSNDGAPPLGNGIEWCVIGYDDMHAYAPGCGQLRPF